MICRRTPALLAGVMLCVFACVSVVFAQGDGRSPVKAEKPAAGTAEPQERLIYLPYKDLKKYLSDDKATVVIPLKDYMALTRKMRSERMVAAQGANGAVDAVITKADYTGKIDGNLARISAEMTVRVLSDQWAEVPVKFGSAAVGNVTSKGKGEVLLRGTGEGRYALLVKGKGDHIITLELLARVRTSPDGKSFSLDVPPVGVTTLDLTVPLADQTVEISPRLVTLPTKNDAGAKTTHIRASLGSTEKITAKWFPKAGAKPQMDLLTAVTNNTLVSIRDGRITTDAYLTYNILRGEFKQAKIIVPAGHKILDITAGDAQLGGWKNNAAAGVQTVTIDLLGAVTGGKSITIEVHTQRPLPNGEFSVAGIVGNGKKTYHGIHATEVLRESGQLVITHESETSVSVASQEGLVRVETNEVNAKIRKTSALNFKYYNPGFSLKLNAKPVRPTATVTQNARYRFSDAADGGDVRFESDLRFDIRRAGVFELRFSVPEGTVIDRVTGSAFRSFNVNDDVLSVLLNGKRQGVVDLKIAGHKKVDGGEVADYSVPILEPQSVAEELSIARETGTLTIYAPGSIEVVSTAAKLKGVTPAKSTAAENWKETPRVASWDYTGRPVDLVVSTKRKPSRLSATVFSALRITPGEATVTSSIVFQVDHAGLDTFRIGIPEAMAKDDPISRNGEPKIKQITRDEKAVDGWVFYTVVLQDRTTGAVGFDVTYDLKQPGDNKAAGEADKKDKAKVEVATNMTSQMQPPRVEGLSAEKNAGRAVALSSVRGELSVVLDRSLMIAAPPETTSLEQVDPRLLEMADARATLAFRYFKQPASLKVTTKQHEIQKVISTVISRALVEVVVGRDPKITCRCRYQIRSSERQRLRLELPAAARVVDVRINGLRTQLELAGKDEAAGDAKRVAYFIDITRDNARSSMINLALLYNAPLEEAPFDEMNGKLQLPMPLIGKKDSDDVAVQELRTVFWVPDDFVVAKSSDNVKRIASGGFFSQLKRQRDTSALDNWIGVAGGGLLTLPTEGNHAYLFTSLGEEEAVSLEWWRRDFSTWVLSGVIFLVGLILLWTSWENKLGFLVLVAFGAFLYAIREPHLVAHALVFASWGLAAVLVMWLIHAAFGRRKIKTAAKAEPDPDSTPPSIDLPPGAVSPPPGVFPI